MTTLRFLNGTHTIGGNIIEVANGDSRVIMDFGVAEDLKNDTVTEAIANHKLPNLPDLLLPNQPQKFVHQAIFISHLHLDHMGALRYLAQGNIPVYLSNGALKLYKLLIKQGIEPEVPNLHGLKDQESIQIGNLSVQGFYSDHDTIDPMALLINDGTHRFLHSGDVRLNGPHRDRVDRWLAAVQNKIDVYLTEATTYSFASSQPQMMKDAPREHGYTESTLQAALADRLAQDSNVLVLNPYPRNVERLIKFNQTANQAKRPIIWEPEFAEIIRSFAPEELLHEVQANQSLPKATNTSYYDWKQLSLELQHNPKSFVLQNTFNHLNRLAEFKQVDYLHSNGEPLGDYDPRFEQLHDFLIEHEINLIPFGASGHGSREDILALATAVNARRTAIWHSFKPELLADDLLATRSEPWLPELDLYYKFD